MFSALRIHRVNSAACNRRVPVENVYMPQSKQLQVFRGAPSVVTVHLLLSLERRQATLVYLPILFESTFFFFHVYCCFSLTIVLCYQVASLERRAEATTAKKKAPDLPASVESSDTTGTAELVLSKLSSSLPKPPEKYNNVAAAVAAATVKSAMAAGVFASTRPNGVDGGGGDGGRSSSSPTMRSTAASSSPKVRRQVDWSGLSWPEFRVDCSSN